MPITYAGQPLAVPTPQFERWAARFRLWDDLVEWRGTPFASAGVPGRDFPPPPGGSDGVRLNTLYWPTGASRWAVFHGLAGTAQLAQIRAAGALSAAKSLVIDDGAGGTVTASLFLLPPRPLAQIGGLPAAESQLHLLTLVDARFFAWGATVGFPAAPATWQAVFDAAGPFGTAPVDAGYGTPSAGWQLQQRPAPLAADAAARAVGLRCVYPLTGSPFLQGWQAGLTADAAAAAAAAGRFAAGGAFVTADITAALPASVSVVFPNDDGTGTNAVVTKNLSDPTVSGGVPQLSGLPGVAGRTATVYADMTGGDPAAAGYASVAARDYYGYKLAPRDATYAGVVAWPPNALTDAVVWEAGPDAVRTRVLREPWWDAPATAAAPPGRAFTVAEVASGSDPLYTLTLKKLLLGAWVDATAPPPGPPPPPGSPPPPPAPVTVQAYREHSNVAPANVPAGQMVVCWKSPTYPGYYEFTPWGGVQRSVEDNIVNVETFCVTLSGGQKVVRTRITRRKLRRYARDQCVTYGTPADAESF